MKVNLESMEIAMARACVAPKELAAMAGVTHDAIVKIIGDRTKKPRPQTLGKIARALGVDVTELIEKEA